MDSGKNVLKNSQNINTFDTIYITAIAIAIATAITNQIKSNRMESRSSSRQVHCKIFSTLESCILMEEASSWVCCTVALWHYGSMGLWGHCEMQISTNEQIVSLFVWQKHKRCIKVGKQRHSRCRCRRCEMLPWSPAAQRFRDNPGADERLTQSSGFGGQ